jgi:hypothetical protein
MRLRVVLGIDAAEVKGNQVRAKLSASAAEAYKRGVRKGGPRN